MNIYSINPNVQVIKAENIPTEIIAGKQIVRYGFHLTPVHPVDKGWYGIILNIKETFANGGSREIDARLYYVFTNNGVKPTMRELFVLASAAVVMINTVIIQTIDSHFRQLLPPSQKEQMEAINSSISQAYPLN